MDAIRFRIPVKARSLISYALICFCLAFLLSECEHSNASSQYAIKNLEDSQIEFVYDENTLLIDTRSSAAFEASNYPNSVNVTIDMVRKNPDQVMKILHSRKFERIVIYCYGGSCDKSQTVAGYLIYTGCDIAVYKAGWNTIKNLLP